MDISLDIVGSTDYRHEISVAYIIDGEQYWVTIIEEGKSDETGKATKVVETDYDFPFELTDELQDEMLSVYESQAADIIG